jgi:hypothetical protein
MRWLSTIARADAGTITVEKMRLDDTGFPQPTGEFEDLGADGKKAARHIDAWLRATAYTPPTTPELASYDHLNTWYYSDAPATVHPTLDLARRTSTFDEVTGGPRRIHRPL